MTNLVTGANGHLGNNVVRALLDAGQSVRASVRNPNEREPFAGLDVEIVKADLMDRDSLMRALEGVDTLYQVAAVFKHWAKNPEEEIIRPAVDGTRNILTAAAEQGVKRIVYVSSSVTIEAHGRKVTEADLRTETHGNPYYVAKIESEKLAWKLAQEYKLNMVSVLPVAIVGPHCYRLTPTMNVLDLVLKGSFRFDVNFFFNYVDARDVAAGMLLAADKGRSGERYLLSTESQPMSTQDVTAIAREFNPKIPSTFRMPKPILAGMATMMELGGQVTGRDPLLLRSQIKLFYGVEEMHDISKAKRELGYNPRSSEQAVREALAYLQSRQ
ncbi:MAG: NAD-dependent epimerase/dehydratase family protein [Aggregatilineales bacterium]